jgi:phosphoserine aminotransferase
MDMENVEKKRKKQSSNNRILANYEGYHLTPFNKNKKVKNFSPGPTNIPSKIFDSIGKEVFSQEKWIQGVSPLEISHRSPEFQKIKKSSETLIKQLLQIPRNYSILWTHGGGNGQFSSVPLNMFKSDKPAGYFINGLWSHKSSLEAEKFGIVKNINLNDDNNQNWDIIDKDYSYLYFCSNETIDGHEFREDSFKLPDKNKFNTPVVVDMSSDIFTKKVDWNKIDVAFACASKNFGIPGSTIVIIKDNIFDNYEENLNQIIPSILDWNLIKSTDSYFNTLPTFNIYITEKILKYYKKLGGIKKMEIKSKNKADLFYKYLDENQDYYKADVTIKEKRSRMNIPFKVGNHSKDIVIKFLKEAYKENIVGLRTKTPFQNLSEIEPLRASFYNSINITDVKYLIRFMEKFRKSLIN